MDILKNGYTDRRYDLGSRRRGRDGKQGQKGILKLKEMATFFLTGIYDDCREGR
ncbi:hypothetical protein FH972_016761 [Carpinus fangiana]|uniref:Uncharacterized protein n=1 Tax=Carpinus fangiana TaxID=176857 RepID=A0A5N6RHD1_9ROSI|nr:hypothetical protein FH972_016761 [Carpinus fangiana]